jgi:hypothetical protein
MAKHELMKQKNGITDSIAVVPRLKYELQHITEYACFCFRAVITFHLAVPRGSFGNALVLSICVLFTIAFMSVDMWVPLGVSSC